MVSAKVAGDYTLKLDCTKPLALFTYGVDRFRLRQCRADGGSEYRTSAYRPFDESRSCGLQNYVDIMDIDSARNDVIH